MAGITFALTPLQSFAAARHVGRAVESKPSHREDFVNYSGAVRSRFDCLIGAEYLEFSIGRAANLGVESISVMAVFPAETNPKSGKFVKILSGFKSNYLVPI